MYDNREEVREASSKALIEATRLVRAPDVGRHVLTIVLQLAHDDENEELRMTAASIAGAFRCRSPPPHPSSSYFNASLLRLYRTLSCVATGMAPQ